jgi:hypothetical protein
MILRTELLYLVCWFWFGLVWFCGQMCGLELQFGIQAFRTCLGQHDHYLNHTGVQCTQRKNIFQNKDL